MTKTGFSNELPHQGRTNTWLTPRWVVDMLCPIDLDPCAAPNPRPFNIAKRNITLPEDGLYADWGNDFVFCNPPYGPHAKRWANKMAGHGNGILFVFARTDSRWFHDSVFNQADAILFLKGRVRFLDQNGFEHGSPAAPSCLVAYGDKACVALSKCGPGKFVSLK